MSGEGRPSRALDLALGACLFALLAAVYLVSPVRVMTDSRYTLLVSHALATEGTWNLGRWILRPDGEMPRLTRRPLVTPWQLLWHRGEVRYFYPVGTSLAAVPVVAALAPFGRSVVSPQGRYAEWREVRLQSWLAALATAATGWVVYRLARRELAPTGAAAIALAAGLGSSLWSVCSRLLFAHTLEALLLALVLLELLRWEDGARRRPVLLGSLLVAGFWVRPALALAALATAGFVAVRHRPALARLVATGAVGVAIFVAVSWSSWQATLPPYYRMVTGVSARGFLDAAWGQIASPSRGFVVYHPALLLVVAALLWRGIPGGRGPLVAWVGGIAAGYVVLYGSWSFWWGGGSFGPRLLAGLIPPLAWLAALAARALAAPVRREAKAPTSRRTLAAWTVAATLVVAAGAWVHGLGAASPTVARRAHEVGADLGRPRGLWSWRRHPAWRPLAAAAGIDARPERQRRPARRHGAPAP